MSEEYKYKILPPGRENSNIAGQGGEGDDLLRIQALLAEWLRMENVVVLSAAGCSVGAGGSLMSSSNEQMNLEFRVLNTLLESDLPKAAKTLICSRMNCQHINFEKWLGLLFGTLDASEDEKSQILSVDWKLHGYKQDSLKLKLSRKKARILKYLRNAIYCECALKLSREEITNENIMSTGHIPFLAKLVARDPRLGRTHLFTLNYDTLFEQALDQLRIQYFDGFTGKALARFDPSVYGLDMHYPGYITEGHVRRYDKFLHFYKLHGSIHWQLDGNGDCTAKHKDLSFASEYRSCSSHSEKAALLSEEPISSIKDFGILPLSKKFSQSLNMPYAHLFRLFQERLAQPQTFFIVIGYGFNDEHVNRIIESALTNPSLVMLVVEPNSNSKAVKKIRYYQNLGQRAYILTSSSDSDNCSATENIATFADFSQNVLPNVQWLEDLRNTRTFEKELRAQAQANNRNTKTA